MSLSRLRVGTGHDIHRLVVGRQLWLGGTQIEDSDRGFDTHSDGDVVCHALIDAIAGAMADGDLGTHYPENDPNSENARSLDFVREFSQYMRSSGFDIVNVDCFVTLGTTRLRPHIQKMRLALADALGADLGCVSVKARSHDGIGEVGMGFAASSTVAVLLEKR